MFKVFSLLSHLKLQSSWCSAPDSTQYTAQLSNMLTLQTQWDHSYFDPSTVPLHHNTLCVHILILRHLRPLFCQYLCTVYHRPTGLSLGGRNAESAIFDHDSSTNDKCGWEMTFLRPFTHINIQIFVGDAIVWWRACAVWPGNNYIRAGCAAILTATIGELHTNL